MAMRLIYPPRCSLCGGTVDSDFGLCAKCWKDTPLISGLTCDLCGVPLPGEDLGEAERCDDCLTIARNWTKGRAAMLYRDNGRKLALALKHGDRTEISHPAALFLHRAAQPLLEGNPLLAPVPLHWSRLLKRRYNQSALLAAGLAKLSGLDLCQDALVRRKKTRSLDGIGADGRFAELTGAIDANPSRREVLRGRKLLLIDDVMTSGATLAAATEAALVGGAKEVSILVLARVAKDA